MPKVDGTRKQRAAELLKRLENGPAFSSTFGALADKNAANEARDTYQLWAKTWVLGELRDLVPELRNQSKT